MDPNEAKRIHDKLDKLTDAVVHLARIDERQIAVAKDLSDLDTRVAVVEAKADSTEVLLQRWINRGIGAWALVGGAGTLFAFLKYFH